MDELKKFLKNLAKPIADKYGFADEFLRNLFSVYPFNEFEYVISHLLAENILTLPDYLDLRESYLARNKYLHLFEITAPRTFGETWAQNHISELVQELERPNRSLDPDYRGQYDFWHKGIKIEVKASRAVKRKSGDSLINKALSVNSPHGFDMNFQQIKPDCFDVSIWLGVWRDEIRYWVLSSQHIVNSRYYSKGQHRGNKGEGQLWIKESNIKFFDKYRVAPKDILPRIIEAS